MRRTLTMLLAAALAILCGCGAVSAEPPAVQEAMLHQNESAPEPLALSFVVDTALGPVFFSAAENFANKINQLSQGEFAVTVETKSGAGSIFAAGSAEFAFLDSRMDSGRCNYFYAVSLPFLYLDYQSFTMTVNSPQVLSMLGEDMVQRFGARALAGYYRPGNQLLSVWQTVDYKRFEGAVIAVDPEVGSQSGILALGSNPVELPLAVERVDWVNQDIAEGAELTLEEIAAAQWLEGDYYITMTYHDLSPVWLVVKDKFYQDLSDRQRAVVLEACAYMFHDVDDVYLAREKELREELEKKNFLFSEDFVAARRELLNIVEAMPEGPVGEAEKFMLNLLQDFRR